MHDLHEGRQGLHGLGSPEPVVAVIVVVVMQPAQVLLPVRGQLRKTGCVCQANPLHTHVSTEIKDFQITKAQKQ